jgi:hypothetical protein
VTHPYFHKDVREVTMNRVKFIGWLRWGMFLSVFLLSSHIETLAKGEDIKSVRVSLCDVLAHPKDFSEKSLIVTVRITATKEGASLWSPDCKKFGVDLLTDASAKSQPGIVALDQVLRLHGMSNHPVIATLSGIFINDEYDEFRHLHRSVFRATAATDIKQSENEEHR